MQRVFQNFVDQLVVSHDAGAFLSALHNAAVPFELQRFAYLLMPHGSRDRAALISNYPTGWTDRYLKERYERVDPVIVSVQIRQEPFEWGLGADNQKLDPAQVRLLEEASAFGIRCGLTIPIHDMCGPPAAVTFASDARRRAFRKSITRNRRVLQFMAVILHAHIRRKLYPDTTLMGLHFSPRERECLHWLAEGKSARDIGQILNISRRTVVFHVENAKRKLGVRTTYQALAILGARNL